jgi:hypothetical protein
MNFSQILLKLDIGKFYVLSGSSSFEPYWSKIKYSLREIKGKKSINIFYVEILEFLSMLKQMTHIVSIVF